MSNNNAGILNKKDDLQLIKKSNLYLEFYEIKRNIWLDMENRRLKFYNILLNICNIIDNSIIPKTELNNLLKRFKPENLSYINKNNKNNNKKNNITQSTDAILNTYVDIMQQETDLTYLAKILVYLIIKYNLLELIGDKNTPLSLTTNSINVDNILNPKLLSLLTSKKVKKHYSNKKVNRLISWIENNLISFANEIQKLDENINQNFEKIEEFKNKVLNKNRNNKNVKNTKNAKNKKIDNELEKKNKKINADLKKIKQKEKEIFNADKTFINITEFSVNRINYSNTVIKKYINSMETYVFGFSQKDNIINILKNIISLEIGKQVTGKPYNKELLDRAKKARNQWYKK